MPRAHRHIVAGHTYHITHRCHDQAFLLRFARDRQAYRDWIRKGLRREKVALLTYCITSNHVHLLVQAANAGALGRFMQYVAGGSAQAYNLRKGRSGAYWSDQYHATMVENGGHLWRCMLYIDLNMVRVGVVKHPREWEWTGWGELMGERRRNRVISQTAVLEALGARDADTFRAHYAQMIETALQNNALQRERGWTKSVAVGSEGFVAQIEQALRRDYTRKRLEREPDRDGAIILRESSGTYGAEIEDKNRSISLSEPLVEESIC